MSVARYFNPRLRDRILAGELPGWLQRHTRKSYIIAAVMSAPPWVDRAALNAIRNSARELTQSSGIKHVCDHVVPLQHPSVCGLTVPWNMQVITYAQNAAKSNKWMPDQLSLDL